ncbi:hypothetical protein [Polaromonas sp.]|nr:hypothetical protein [Burkholderiales bacterium]
MTGRPGVSARWGQASNVQSSAPLSSRQPLGVVQGEGGVAADLSHA